MRCFISSLTLLFVPRTMTSSNGTIVVALYRYRAVFVTMQQCVVRNFILLN